MTMKRKITSSLVGEPKSQFSKGVLVAALGVVMAFWPWRIRAGRAGNRNHGHWAESSWD